MVHLVLCFFNGSWFVDIWVQRLLITYQSAAGRSQAHESKLRVLLLLGIFDILLLILVMWVSWVWFCTLNHRHLLPTRVVAGAIMGRGLLATKLISHDRFKIMAKLAHVQGQLPSSTCNMRMVNGGKGRISALGTALSSCCFILLLLLHLKFLCSCLHWI